MLIEEKSKINLEILRGMPIFHDSMIINDRFKNGKTENLGASRV